MIVRMRCSYLDDSILKRVLYRGLHPDRDQRESAYRKMVSWWLILRGFALLITMEMVSPARILFIYPVPYPSHFRALIPLVEELANRGHQITAYTSLGVKKSLENYKEIRITVDENSPKVDDWGAISGKIDGAIARMHEIWNFFSPITEAALQSKELQALMKSQQEFDLIIVEATCNEESLLAFSHKFGAPVVNYHPFFQPALQAQLSGTPHSFSYIPNTFLSYSDRMSFWQRMKNMFVGMYNIVVGNLHYLPMQERMMRKYFNYSGSETLPPLKELIANISLHLILTDPLMSYVRPLSPNVINVAGMNIKPTGKLPQDLQKFMDEATEGVIYVSFGHYIDADLFSTQAKDVITETLRGLKQRVIWKWSEKIDGASNILTKTWLPQQEILAHPNCKLFITHGGFNSLMETIRSGVPVVGIPFSADQHFNLAYYKQHGVGLEIDLKTVTVSQFTNTIDKILQTPSFRENAKRLAAISADVPHTNLENAVYWVEYVIRHKGAHHLKPASVKMPYYQYLLLDVIAFLAISLISVVCISYYFMRKIVLMFKGANYVSQAKKSK